MITPGGKCLGRHSRCFESCQQLNRIFYETVDLHWRRRHIKRLHPLAAKSRFAIIDIMGGHVGYIALGTDYGWSDIILVPEQPLDCENRVKRVKELYDLQKNVVI